MVSCSLEVGTAKVLRVRLAIPVNTISVSFHVSICFMTAPSGKMCLRPAPSCVCPILPASNAFSAKKGKMVTQGGMCDSHLCPELDHVSEVYDSVLRNEDIRCNLSF